ncbi:MAG TPA: hypothetical protein VGQ26_17710 [Streptosporangiaceae bacterium]|jgi:hypothetical protein|nr:hypothetical protein [Streptosporangiaceae bacterium]
MGGSAASHNNFWQLFVRPAGTGRWRLATPPGVASNGGLVVAGLGAGSVVAGFRPSQDLSFSPLAFTHDNGAAWKPGLLDSALADVPDALAAAPGSGRLLALLANGGAELSRPGGTAWTRLAARQALAASAAGGRCGLGRLTAAAFSPSGVPLLAGSCARPGTAGVFAYAGGTWHPVGPALPASYARQKATVLRLTTASGTTMALLAAGTGSAARLLAASSTGSGAQWALSQPLPLHSAGITSASFGPGGAVAIVLTGGHGEALTGTAAAWRPLPALPPGTVTLAPAPPAGGTPLPSTAPGWPSGGSRPAAPPGPPHKPSTSPSGSGHRADATTSRSPSAIGLPPEGGPRGGRLRPGQPWSGRADLGWALAGPGSQMYGYLPDENGYLWPPQERAAG